MTKFHAICFTVGWIAASAAGCNWGGASNPSQQAATSNNSQPNEDSAANGASDQAPGDFANNVDLLGIGGIRPSNNPQRDVADPYYYTGQALPEWQLAEWANSDPLTLESLRGRVVVVHFWTDDSQRSMQAMQQLANEFPAQKVTFVGAYCSQGRLLEAQWRDALTRAREWGVTFPLAYDRQWRTLTEWWLSRYDNLPLTPTFVLDPAGEVIHLHPGPELFPSDDPVERLCNDDFQSLRAAIGRGLAGQLAESRRQ